MVIILVSRELEWTRSAALELLSATVRDYQVGYQEQGCWKALSVWVFKKREAGKRGGGGSKSSATQA